MQIQLLRKGAQKPLKVKKEIPAAYWSLQSPHAVNHYLPLANGGIFRRNFRSEGFDLNIIDCWADDAIPIDITTDGNFLTVLHVVGGDVSCYLRSGGLYKLKTGYSYLLYLPLSVRNELRFEAGEHRLLFYCLKAELLRELGYSVPAISALLDKINGGSKIAQCTGEANNKTGVSELVKELEASTQADILPVANIHDCIYRLLCEQVIQVAQQGGLAVSEIIPGWIERLSVARKMVDEGTGMPLRISFVARKCRVNDRQLKVGFRLRYGSPFAQYQIHVRLERARKLLLETDDAIQTIGLQIGYEDESSFTKRFKRAHGLTPLQYRRKYRP